MNRTLQAKGQGLKQFSALICVFLLSVLIISCGNGEDETISKAAFIKQGNAVCKEALKEREAAAGRAFNEQGGGKTLTKADIEKVFIEVVLPNVAQMTDELAQLDEPDSGAEAAAAFVGSLEEGIDSTEDELAKYLEGSVDPFGKARKQAEAYGLQECTSI